MSKFAELRSRLSFRRDKYPQLDSRQAAEFMPAMLAIQESPPHPLAKWLGRSLMTLFVLVVIWLCIGKVNVVATAEGKIIPSSRVKQIQPLEKGIVKSIYVHEGQLVNKGDALIELDRTMTESTVLATQSKLKSQKLMLAVSESLSELSLRIESNSQPTLTNVPVNATAHEIQLHSEYLSQRWQQYSAEVAGYMEELDEVRAQMAVSGELVRKLEKLLPIVRRRHANFGSLLEKGFVSETDFLEIEQELISKEQDLEAEKQRSIQLAAAISKTEQRLSGYRAQYRAEIINEIAQLRNSISLLEEELSQVSNLNAKQVLYAPVSGQVQQLAVNTIGGVVTEAQPLMAIVPSDGLLEAEVLLHNKDIGFVQEDMATEVKIHTFPFTKYGLIEGEVSNISDDAVMDEQQGLVYKTKVILKNTFLNVNGKQVDLIPGMTLTAEVRIDKRRIIEFFLEPILKTSRESLRER